MIKMEDIRWWHRIPLPDGRVTPGIVDHCDPQIASERFGMPADLNGKSVLDIGTWDGYFAFLAEERGAQVIAIDCYQKNSSGGGVDYGPNGFLFAHYELKSNVSFIEASLLEYCKRRHKEDGLCRPVDISLYYGVLYHVENPMQELKYLYDVTKEYALIETAICDPSSDRAYWEHRPGFEGDPTNQFYPSLKGLETTLKEVGFSSVEVIHVLPGRQRATVKAIV